MGAGLQKGEGYNQFNLKEFSPEVKHDYRRIALIHNLTFKLIEDGKIHRTKIKDRP